MTGSPHKRINIGQNYMAAFCACALGFALFTQHVLGMSPCTICIEIRLWLFVGLFFSVLSLLSGRALKYTSIAFQFVAVVMIYISAWWAGKLVYLEYFYEGIGGCSPVPFFYYDIPLGDWIPSVFSPFSICGEESNLLIFIPYSVATLVAMLGASFVATYMLFKGINAIRVDN